MLSAICSLIYSTVGTYILLSYNNSVSFYAIIIPFLVLVFLYGLFLLVFRKIIPATIISSALLLLIFFADAFVYQVRFFHIRYSDIIAVDDALRVAKSYSFSITSNQISKLIIVVATCVMICAIAKRHTNPKKSSVVLTGAICITLTAAFFCADTYFGFIPKAEEGLNSSKYVPTYGLVYSWYNQYKNSRLQFPDEYSIDLAQSILKSNTSLDKFDHENTDYPDIVVIMNESLADYNLCGQVTYKKDPLPNIHDIRNGISENRMLVSIFGGYTANTEFEFLTGSSLLFLPKGTIPYMRFMDHKMPSLVQEFNSIGYNSTAIHPYYSAEWNRTNAYKCLGFERFFSGDEIVGAGKKENKAIRKNLFAFGDDVEYIRGFISDEQCYKYILSSLDEMKNKSPSFIFAVTIQNHGGYLYVGDDFSSEKYTGITDVDQYLTLSRESDEAFYRLIEQLKKRKRKTVVLMFGDHQPAINIDETIRWDNSLEEVNKYVVPYVIWSNYNANYDLPDNVSSNYLSAVLKKEVGIPLTEWDNFRLNIMKDYPVITANVIKKDMKWLLPSKKVVDKSVLHNYEIVQDYLLFDAEVE